MNRGRPSRRRAQILGYVRETIAKDGVAPSYGMICRDLGIGSHGEVRRIVCDLESLGKLRRAGKGRVRRIQITS